MTQPTVRVFVLLCVLSLATLVHPVLGFEIDAVTNVTRVIDGDTFDTSSQGKIRLADIDAPESNEYGYVQATNALFQMVNGKEVSLDIDDKTRQDQYGRLICVVYVRLNSTHLTNVNKALLDQGHAVARDFTNNEFDPGNWRAYEYSPQAPQSSPPTNPMVSLTSLVILLVFIVIVVSGVVAVGYFSRRSRGVG